MRLKNIFIIALMLLSVRAFSTSVTIGGNATTSDHAAPYSNYYKYATVQMLYSPTEIGKSGKINSIAFKVASQSSLSTSELKVYLGHKSSTFASASDYLRSSSLTLVYSGSPTIGSSTGWETLTFNQGSFTYNGTDNLVVVITRKSASYTNSLKYYYTETSNRVLRRCNDDNSSYGNLTSTSAYSTLNELPTIRIDIEETQSENGTGIIGDNSTLTTNSVPYSNYYKYATVQMLYSPTEIGKSGKITSIAFKVAAAYSLSTSELKVYLGHKSGTFSSTSDYLRSSSLTLVYSGSPTLGSSTGWETLNFNQGSFTYNGTDNLVVVVTRKSSSSNSSLKYYYTATSNSVLRRYSDSYNTYAEITNTASYSSIASRACIKIDFEDNTNTNSFGDNATKSTYDIPYGNFFKYSTSQMLYTPAEVGKSGKITSIAFKVAYASSFSTSQVRVYLGHKSSTFSSAYDYLSSSSLTLVYSGSPTIGSKTGWETLDFNQGSFTYNGTDNLVVVVTRKSTNYNSGLKYYYVEGSGYTLYRISDEYSSYGDLTTTSGYSTITTRPSIRFNIEETQSSGGTGIIGDNTTLSTNDVPYSNCYRYSSVQMLYSPTEIGKSGKINSIAFKVATANSLPTSELKVYLGHKAGTFSSTYDYLSSSSLELVYSGSPTLGSNTGWETLYFNQGSFTYNGTDNLVVVVTRKSTNYNCDLKYYYTTTSNRVLARVSDATTGYGDLGYTYSYSTYTNRASVKIGFNEVEIPISSATDYDKDGVTYTLNTNGTAQVKGLTAELSEVAIADTVNYSGFTFKVTSVGASAFSAHPNLSVTLPSSITTIHNDAFNDNKVYSVIWNCTAKLTSSHINKMKNALNVLIFVNNSNQLDYTSLSNIANVVVNKTARIVELNDGYNYYCPVQFTANNISYKRWFSMTSGYNGSSAGWESIALPFTVSTIRHETKGELTPFYSYTSSSTKKPFWLYSWSSYGWKKASSISHNTPYIICMPNNDSYQTDYNLAGYVTFSATYATLYKTDSDYSSSTYNGKAFYPTFVTLTKSDDKYNINVGSTSTQTGGETPGSAFIRNLRNTRPFEGYIYSNTATARIFPVSPFNNNDGEATGIMEADTNSNHLAPMNVYDTKGQLIIRCSADNIEQELNRLPEGIYIVNGKKRIVKK